ncbi:TPR repeat [Duganella sp. CF458]|uniref:hypothetical protein n=1 Tax=Duganella sp. CF458 TaxID=1884368 RepID=UPI0008F36B3E|nr:hypothetical protein [Duganella sp. CF458]SFG10254.1 TPR repeat [Duganella sp. CF458]
MKQKLFALALLGMGIGLAGAARADMASAQAAYETGRCEDAIKALTPIAKAGDPAAQKALGDVYLDDERHCPGQARDAAAAESWYLPAARSGNVAAQRGLIHLYEYSDKPGKPEQATFWVARVAEQGAAGDLSKLAARHERAEGVPHDRVLAHTFRLLASRRNGGNDGASLGQALHEGALAMSPEQLAEAESLASAWKTGMPLPTTSVTGKRDPRDWYKEAAKAGDLNAAHKAGTLYWKGVEGLEVDAEQAAFWLRKAAQGGISDAQYQLSQLYAMGYGVPKDFVLGYVLHSLAVRGGNQQASARKHGWDDSLTSQQLGEGMALLAKWKKGDALPLATRYGMQRKVNYVDDATGKLTPTADVLALFKAANEGDEESFARLLGKVDHINEYLVDRQKLLHALLLPAESLRAEADAWRNAGNDARDTAHWHGQQERHAALLPVKTRMLALALKRGASFNEGTARHNAAPLHLAAMFGTPEMVRLLLKHGADPRHYGGEGKSLAPLEFSLEQHEYGLGLPELITPEMRTESILALLQAGAQRPYIRYDGKLKRPSADYLLWPNLVALTHGTAVLDALLKTGTRPAGDEDGKTTFGYAAEAGNVEAIAWLKKRVPRYGKDRRDRWLDAAMLAMYSSAAGRDKVLRQLLVKDMKWAQEGPQDEGYGRSHRPLYGGMGRVESGTLPSHLIRARRLDWLPGLAALGVPANTGASRRELVDAVRENDVELVKVLLAQGADPLEEPESALSLALKAPEGKSNMLDVLLDHIAQVRKKSLAEMGPWPIEEVLGSAHGISVTRLRKLLDAGASAEGLGGRSIDAAFRAPDRSVADLLIRHGMLGKPGAAPNFLLFAIGAGRADLLPVIVAQGGDPNHRDKARNDSVQPNAVEYAISQGNMEALKVLLAHGGVIDTATAQPWGTALDRAVVSLNVDMLRTVSKDFGLSLKQACLKSNVHLAKVVLESPASYWALLREHGFGSDVACVGSQERLALYLADTGSVLLEGWMGRQLLERLPQLGPGRDSFSVETWEAIGASRHAALAGLLAKAGWTPPVRQKSAEEEALPQDDKAADLALQAKLPGHYYLSGVREMGAEILLRPNGKFQYSMSYGAVDEFAQGSWEVWNQQVVFRSDSTPARAASMQVSTDAPSDAVPAGQVLVDLRYRGRSIPGFKVVLLGEAPSKAEGNTGGQGWRTAFSGPVRQIAVSHPEVDEGKWLVHEVAASDAQRRAYQLDFQPPAPAPQAFNHTLEVRDGSLVLEGTGRPMEFQKH